MSLKYCDDCHEPVEQVVMSCPKCMTTTFVHGAEIMKRDKIERAERSKTQETVTSSQPTSTSSVAPAQKNQKIEKANTVSSSAPSESTTIVISKTGKTLDDLIRAQNKTTHAVRAFVRFLFIQLTGLTLAYFLWNLSIAFADEDHINGNPALQFMAIGVWIATVIFSSHAGWDELQKSEIN